jgi:dCMP deaminase
MVSNNEEPKIEELLEARPDFDTYYLTMAFVAARRSFDPSTKCGCVLVSKDGRVLSSGYNGPIKGSVDAEIPLTRPEKYCHMVHSEENALLAYSGSQQDIEGGTAYITTQPCHKCLRMLLQKGITRIVYGSGGKAVMINDAENEAQEIMIYNWEGRGSNTENPAPRVEMLIVDVNKVQDLLNETNDYIAQKKDV